MDMKFILVTAGVVLAVLLCLMYMGYGEIGGPAEMLKDLIGENLGMERQPISISQNGNDFHVQKGKKTWLL